MFEPVRKYIYGLIVPVSAVLILYGILDEVSAPVWIGIVEALLAVPAVEIARSRVTPVRLTHDVREDEE